VPSRPARRPMCLPVGRTIKRSKWRWTCCAERPPMPPSRPIPRRPFLTDEPDAVRSTNPSCLFPAFSRVNPEFTAPLLHLDSGLGRQYLSSETSPGKIFAAYLVVQAVSDQIAVHKNFLGQRHG